MSRVSKATLRRERMAQFNRYWDDLYKVLPEARREAVQAMGEAVKKELDAQIDRSDFQADAKPTIRNWQELSFGSRGGYAAISPVAKKLSQPKSGKPKKWRGMDVSSRMVTKWLDRGYGTRKPAAGSVRAWNSAGRNGGVRQTQNQGYVKGRMFYSWTESRAQEAAIRAADKVLSAIADEVDY